jgi:hypothetical protein
MRNQLIQLIRANPFVPFTVTMKDHEVIPIGSVELIGVGTSLFFVVDPTGIIIHHRLSSIYSLGVRDTEPA